jgi:CheY-like chemotaxis protein
MPSHVLVVEDDDLVRQHTVQSLETLGYTVSAFANGEGAIEAVRGGLSYDLLLTDVVLPGRMSGRDVANALATIRPSAKVLYMSGYTENSIVHHGRLDAGINLLSKPFRLGDLARKIRQVLALV